MELQLGLALPSTNNVNVDPIKRGLDLNINDFLHRPTKKRSFCQLANFEPSNKPWLLWNNQPNDDDDDDVIQDRNSSGYNNTGNEEDDGLVGWPPVKLCRKEALFHVNGDRGRRNVDGAGGSASTFVKVKMEGVAIARKVDLSIHDSFPTLMRTLMPMFDKCEMDSNNYKLTYQDMEGDWLLADDDQDVPWRTFTQSVQRLNLLKIEE